LYASEMFITTMTALVRCRCLRFKIESCTDGVIYQN